MNHPRFSRGLAACAALILATAAMQAHGDPRNKWRIEFDNHAKSAGELVLRFTPEKGGTPTDVVTKFENGVGENQSADILRKSLKAQLGKAYNIDVDDGEDVLIKRKGKTPKFEITVVSNTVENLKVEVQKD
jgi:hypothetical protein